MSKIKYRLDMLKKPIWKFVNAGDFAKENLLYIQESGRFCSGKNYYTKRSGLESYLIKITVSGKGILEYCGEVYTLTPGSIMFIDCKQQQNYHTDRKSKKWETVWVHFYGKNAKAYYEKYLEKTNGSPVSVLSDNSSANEIFENILTVSENYAKNSDSEIIADNLLNSLITECITKNESEKVSAPDYIKEIAGYLRHNYHEEINLDMLANEFNVSKYHLQRMFKKNMGVSPAKYLLNIRINRAKSLLRGTNYTISEIAEKIGIETNYFIQTFKALENTTPKQYRNSWSGYDTEV